MHPFSIIDVHDVLVQERQHELRHAERQVIHKQGGGLPLRDRVAGWLIQAGEKIRSQQAAQPNVDADVALKAAA